MVFRRLILLRYTFYCQFIMSFRDTFTRGSGNEHLQYDDTASMFFVATVLLVLVVSLTVHLLRKVLWPWGNIRGLKEASLNPTLSQKVAKFKEERRFSFFTFWFVVKTVLLIALLYFFLRSVNEVRRSHQNIKGFDPYELLEVDPSASPEAIRKAYRRLALIYHPDRNDNDPQASAKFIMISKAYECLTNQDARENCQKFGNPDGSTSFNVGIALPSFLVQKQNQVKVMVVVFVILVIIIPLSLICWNSRMNKFDNYGMRVENHGMLVERLNQQLSVRDISKIIGMFKEFQDSKNSDSEKHGLADIHSQADAETRVVIEWLAKKRYFLWVKRTIMLLYGRQQEAKIPVTLNQSNLKILKEVPKLINAIVHMMLPSSLIWHHASQGRFLGLVPMQNMIYYLQYFIQGRAQGKPSFCQLDLTEAEIDTLTRKNKSKLTIPMLQEDPEKLERFLNPLDASRREYIKSNIFSFPQVACTTVVFTEDEEGLTDKDLVTVKTTLTRKQLTPFAFAPKYPFLKQECWYYFLSNGKKIIHFERFEFEQLTKSISYLHRKPLKAGKHKWNVTVMPDCYYGLDLEETVDFKVDKDSFVKRKAYAAHSQDKAIEHTHSFLENLMNSMRPPQDIEISDKEDNEDEQTTDKKEQAPPLPVTEEDPKASTPQ